MSQPAYTIEIEYTTGSSFHSETCKEVIGPVWRNLEVAQQALKYIEEHYKLYQQRDRVYRSHEADQLFKQAQSKPWFKNCSDKEYINVTYWYPCFALPTDDGGWIDTHVFWCGYFETMHSAEIVMHEDPSMKVTF